MTFLSYEDLGELLPAGSIEFVGNNQLKTNFSQLTDSELTLQTSCVKGVVKLLEGLAKLTDQVNQSRINEDNLPPVEFVSQTLTGTPEQPEYEFKVRVKVDTALFMENLDDPTD